MRWLGKMDALLWMVGALLAVAGVVDGLRTGRTFGEILGSAWTRCSGLLFVLAAVVLGVVLFRWRAAREEADLLRKHPNASNRVIERRRNGRD